MPMHQFRRIGVVDDFHCHRLAFPHAQHRPRRSAVIADGRKNVRAVELHRDRRDAQGKVRFARLRLRRAQWRQPALPGIGRIWPFC